VVIVLSLLTPLLNSCKTTREPIYKYVYVYPNIYIPDYPKINDLLIVPLDYDGHVIDRGELTEDNPNAPEIANVIIPYWFLIRWVDYGLDVTTAKVEYEQFVKNYKN